MKTMTATALIALSLATSAGARPQDPSSEMEVHETVNHFLELLGELRFYALGQYMTDDANVIVARWSRSGFVHQVRSRDEWLSNLMDGPAPRPFEEKLANVEIEVVNDTLALVRADFEVVRDTGVASYGVDFFTLVRQKEGWKIASIAYTSLPASERAKN